MAEVQYGYEAGQNDPNPSDTPHAAYLSVAVGSRPYDAFAHLPHWKVWHVKLHCVAEIGHEEGSSHAASSITGTTSWNKISEIVALVTVLKSAIRTGESTLS